MTQRSCAVTLFLVLVAIGTAQATPRSDYLLHCGGCHLENGQGTPPEVPDLRQDLDWLAASAAGRSYLTRVPGASQVPLSDQRLAGIYNWIFSVYYPLQTDIALFSAEEITATRSLPLHDPLSARNVLVKQRAGSP
ncbi:MAG: cytochrome c [Congregibacter sp.]